jgi:hypothetical protein
MCIICEGNYDENVVELDCMIVKEIKEYRYLPNLVKLNCVNLESKRYRC